MTIYIMNWLPYIELGMLEIWLLENEIYQNR